MNEDIFYSHKNDHALGLLQTDKGKTSGKYNTKITFQKKKILVFFSVDKLVKNNSTSDTSNNSMKNARQPNVSKH